MAQIGSQVLQHLSQYSQHFSAGLSEAVALRVMSGSVVVEVTLSGEQVDGASLARLLESDVDTGRLKMVLTIGYVPCAEPMLPCPSSNVVALAVGSRCLSP